MVELAASYVPSDVVLAVDNSSSMVAESQFVQDSLSVFARSSLDPFEVRVVLISATGSFSTGICVPTPLGSGMCPADTNLPRYSHNPRQVGSSNALTVILEEFDTYSGRLRAESFKHFAVVSDDNAGTAAAAFDSGLRSKLSSASLGSSYLFHGIFAARKGISICDFLEPAE